MFREMKHRAGSIQKGLFTFYKQCVHETLQDTGIPLRFWVKIANQGTVVLKIINSAELQTELHPAPL